MFDTLLCIAIQEGRHSVRLLWRSKAFAIAAVSTLAFGIATTTLMFALVQGIVLRPLPVREQDRLILSWREAPTTGSAVYPFGDAEIDAVARETRLLESVAGVSRNGVARSVLSDGSTSSYASVGLITGGFFEVLGAEASLGRRISVADDREGAEPVAVISHGYWQRRFGGAADVIGRRVTLGERPCVIVGVMPSDLDYPQGVEVWRTTRSMPVDGAFGAGARREVNLIARLRPGVTVAQARSELAAMDVRLASDGPADGNRRLAVVVRPYADVVIGDVRRPMIALFGAVAFVLLIACANVANLLHLRGEGRRGELAVRAALGAGRGRIAAHAIAESLVLSGLAGVVGAWLAWAALPLVITLVPEGLPRVESIRIDAAVVGFAVAVALLTTLLAGVTAAMWWAPVACSASCSEKRAGGSAGGYTTSPIAGTVVRDGIGFHAIDLHIEPLLSRHVDVEDTWPQRITVRLKPNQDASEYVTPRISP